MRDCRLIFTEGLMGSGKSTLATQIALELQDRNIDYRYHWESEMPHPIKMRQSKGKWAKSAEELIERSLSKWQAFLDAARNQDRITLLDGQLFHGNASELFKENGTKEQIEAYICELVELIKPLKPRVIYFHQQDTEAAFRKVEAERGARWAEIHVKSKTECLYGKKHGLAGFAGLVQFSEDYRKLTDHLFEVLDLPKLSIDNTAGDWTCYNQQVFEFLDLTPVQEKLVQGNAHLNQGKCETPSTLWIENQTDRCCVVYEWQYKKPMALYQIEVLPRERRFFKAYMGNRFRIHDVTSGEILQDVIAWQSDQEVKIAS